MKKVLIVVAHPDDEVLGMGGTIAKHVSDGDEVVLLIVTDGSTSQYKDDVNLNEIISKKKEETEEAARILGISKVLYGELPDMKLDITSHTEVNASIERVIDLYQPEIVYTHFDGDINLDHRCVFQSTLVACRPVPGQCVREVYSFSVPSSTEWNTQNVKNTFMPNVYVDIDGFLAEKKYLAMAAYNTEMRLFPHPRSIEALRILDQSVGLQVGLKKAESFMLHRVIR